MASMNEIIAALMMPDNAAITAATEQVGRKLFCPACGAEVHVTLCVLLILVRSPLGLLFTEFAFRCIHDSFNDLCHFGHSPK